MIEVVTVDKKGKQIGTMERLLAHKNPGTLHRAISVVLYRRKQKSENRKQKAGLEILLQKRSEKKPLWPKFWANTVCTHPVPGEGNLDCAVRRLKEEMGIVMDKKDLRELYAFSYQAYYNQELSEHEYDTVILGRYEGVYELNPDEAEAAKWMELGEMREDLKRNPEIYAPWPRLIFKDERLIHEIG